jgi:hypothetical protein
MQSIDKAITNRFVEASQVLLAIRQDAEKCREMPPEASATITRTSDPTYDWNGPNTSSEAGLDRRTKALHSNGKGNRSRCRQIIRHLGIPSMKSPEFRRPQRRHSTAGRA